jgi:folate-binding protein YgfZ
LLQHDDSGFCVLDGYGLIRVAGEDALGFLQGQATCDVKALAPGRSGLGAFCTPKGRVVASFRLLRSGQGFYLLLSAGLAAAARKRLQMHVLRSKVALEDLSPAWSLTGVFGAGGASALAAAGVPVPDQPGGCLEQPDGLALRLEEGRCLVAAEAEFTERLRASLRDALPEAGPELWSLKTIEAGIPEVTAAIAEEFLPQMLNLDALGGVGLQKGCYTGQEIVTRTHFLGQIKRRMFRLRCQGGEEPIPGTSLYDAAEAEPKSVGQVVAAAPEPGGGFQLLAVIGLDRVPGADLRVFRPDGPKAELLVLPYTC